MWPFSYLNTIAKFLRDLQDKAIFLRIFNRISEVSPDANIVEYIGIIVNSVNVIERNECANAVRWL
ncbi:hypothetical protein C5467_03585 [Photorhabdus khanii subsp. guanajuatensis]|uniref:Uncharacterized protein n=1 Tax=Photorhabdus khanii subsp. guanajuatensis TaxID=2100166 RepID=A0A4R4K6S8_9GAMM|nr:hypothetical protein C5467_03585 [Photorhabdus khanii subsp. guanajuatensis]